MAFRKKIAFLFALAFAKDGTPPKNADFLNMLPEAMRGDPSLVDVQDVPSLAQRFVETKKLVGMDKVVLPKDPTDPLWHSEVWPKLGRPKTWEEYKTALPKIQFPEGFSLDEGGVDKFLQEAHKMGIPAQMVSGLYKMHAESQAAAYTKILQDYQNETSNAEKANRELWGKDYDTKTHRANKLVAAFAKKLGWDQAKIAGLTGAYGKDPVAMQLFAAVADAVSDDVLGPDGDIKQGMTQDEIRGEIAKLEKSPAWTNAEDPEHQAVIQRLNELYNAVEG